ncbi:MAG: sigma-70 family RNA polymerase sigma factor, partial [Pseudomonadota bacterium]
EAPEPEDPADRPDDVLLAAERRALIDEAIAKLPNRQRLAIVLCHYQELSQAEASGIMGVSIDAFESLLARGRRTLKARLTPLRASLTGKMSDGQNAQAN